MAHRSATVDQYISVSHAPAVCATVGTQVSDSAERASYMFAAAIACVCACKPMLNSFNAAANAATTAAAAASAAAPATTTIAITTTATAAAVAAAAAAAVVGVRPGAQRDVAVAALEGGRPDGWLPHPLRLGPRLCHGESPEGLKKPSLALLQT
jgi:hypothetical protein